LNKLSKLALATLACCVTGLAHADTTFSANFAFEGGLPMLRTGNPAFDGPHSLPGDWGQTRIDATANSRDLLSSTVNPATGALEQTWGEINWSDNMHRSSGSPLSMGESHAYIAGPNDYSHTLAEAGVYRTSLGAGVTLTDRFADANAHATWSRDFSLDAHSSLTLSGLATVGITGDSNPLSAATTFNSNASFASLQQPVPNR